MRHRLDEWPDRGASVARGPGDRTLRGGLQRVPLVDARTGVGLDPGSSELDAGVLQVAGPPCRIGQVSVQHPDLLGVQAGQRDDPAQLGATGCDVTPPHEQPGAFGLELRQVVVVAQLAGQRDRLVEGAQRRVEVARDALQLAE